MARDPQSELKNLHLDEGEFVNVISQSEDLPQVSEIF